MKTFFLLTFEIYLNERELIIFFLSFSSYHLQLAALVFKLMVVESYFCSSLIITTKVYQQNKMTITEYLDSVAKEVGSPITISQFVRFERGEGIEKKADNFADEVASMIK